MNSIQYEELCRYFLSKMIGLPTDNIFSGLVPNPRRKDLPQYKHQIDLYWEIEDSVCKYLNIVNAKWRSTEKIGQPDILLLQQVKQKVSAHKAVMITNTDFTSGAVAAAKDEGIALHIVRPSFNTSFLASKDRAIIQAKLQKQESLTPQTIYQHGIVHKAFELGASTSHIALQRGAVFPSYSIKMADNSVNKAIGGYTNKGCDTGGHPDGGSSGAPLSKGGGGDFHTK